MSLGTVEDQRRKKGSFIVKKFVCFMLCMALVLCLAVTAFASTHFSFSTTATSGYPTWCGAAKPSGKNWHFTWDSDTNIASDHRAVVCILTAEGNYASALWVYSSKSTKYHPYNDSAAYGKAYTCPAGRLDDRDSGTLIVIGDFYN